MNVLLVEDEFDFQRVLAEYLTLSGYDVETADHGKEGLEKFKKNHVDICILDVMMPVMDGFTLAEHIRKLDMDIPIIFLTAKNQKQDKLKGLKLGADDYITKPFDAEELVLRMNNILRRTVGSVEENKFIGGLQLKMDQLKLITEQQEYQVTIREAELLNYLIKNTNKVVSREQILEDLWGQNDYFLGRSMDMFISRLRKYLQSEPSLSLETKRGVGFILKISSHTPV